MTLFTDEVCRAFLEHAKQELYDDLRSTYNELTSRRIGKLLLPDQNVSPVDHAKFCCRICSQALLHRAINLFEASINSLLKKNIYATTICVRGHIEATASMGYVYKRAMSLLEGNLSLEEFHENLARQILGSKDIEQAPTPINIMTMIQGADKIINKHIFVGENKNMLTDCYEFLSEFAHPNFHSYSLALRVDPNDGLMVIKYNEGPRDEDFGLIGYIDISNRIFLELLDRFGNCGEQIQS